MSEVKATFRELQKGIRLPVAGPHVVSIFAGKGHLIEMEDVNFHFDSAVLLPDPRCGNNPDVPAQDRITGLSVLRAAYLHAGKNPSEKLLIAGHADTTGKPDYNITLSQQRADNVRFALLGDRAKWAANSNQKHQVEDCQAVLKWIDERFGWGTDPGAIDNVDGTKTQAAIRAFQTRYNKEFKKSLAVNGAVTLATWESFFDLYMQGLRELLDADGDDLEAARGTLAFLDDKHPTVGCGENHPIEAAAQDEFRSETNRRVELLFFDPQDQLPKLDCHAVAGKCKPEVCQIYGKGGLFDFAHIPCDPLAGVGSLLTLSTTAEDDETVDLVVEEEDGKIARTMQGNEAVREGKRIDFTIDPETLPKKVRLTFLKNGIETGTGSLVDPRSLREALRDQRLADAAEITAGSEAPSDTRVAGPGGGGAPAGTVGIAQGLTPGTDLRVMILYDHPENFLLATAAVTLSKSTFVASESRQGKHVFDVQASANEVDLAVDIPDVLALRQKLQIIRDQDPAKPVTFGALTSPLNPRVLGVTYGQRSTRIIEIRLDLTFLNVNARLIKGNQTFNDYLALNQEGCNVVVLEHTPGRPAAWAIGLPPNLDQAQGEAELFLFFQHEMEFKFTPDGVGSNALYTNTDDASYFRLEKYFSVQTANEPDSSGKDVPQDQEGRYVLGAESQTFPNFGWLRQLKKSAKKVPIVLPLPHGTDFGIMADGTSSAKRTLRSLLICLQAEGFMGKNRAGLLRLERMAVGGWSSGTENLVKWINATIPEKAPLSKEVQEIYFFDGKANTRSALTVPGPAHSWFRPGRRLRLMGTANTETASNILAASLGNPKALDQEIAGGTVDLAAPVRAMPGRSDFWYSNAFYKQALTPRIKLTGANVMDFRPPGALLATPAVDVTDEANIFLVSKNTAGGTPKASITLMSPAGGANSPRTIAFVSTTEAAFFLNFIILGIATGGQVVSSPSDFKTCMDLLEQSGDKREPVRVFQHRHAWAVIGGMTGFKGRPGFTGHLQICLELSGFR
ncbi:MAG: hypothetical protein JWO30_4234 [Fibrobacteres bacterium]|nr:hypothetical protein [Fibrobacterota bacterium]